VSELTKKKFEKILNTLGIEEGDNLLVSSNILKILYNRKNSITSLEIIECLKKKISNQGNLLFPAYNWGFCKGQNFYHKDTKSLTGALGNLTLKLKEFKRSINPIYSFLIYGKDANYISNLKHSSCFVLKETPFGYLINNNGKNLFIGLDYKEALTFVHVAEEEARAEYRYFKYFKGTYTYDSGISKKVSYKMYVRKLRQVLGTLVHKKFDNELIKNNALSKSSIGNIKFAVIDIKKTYDLILKDLKSERKYIYTVKR